MSEQAAISTHTIGPGEIHTAGAAAGQPRAARRAAPSTASATNASHRPGAEYFDDLLWRVESRRVKDDSAAFLLGLTSCRRRSGVSTVAANLAIRAADHGLGPVLLADFNIHSPALHTLLHAKHRSGVAEVLAGQASLEACIQATPIAGLQLLPAGTITRSDHLREAPERIEQLVSTLREQFTLVIVDLPAADHLGPAMFMAAALDAAILVVRSEETRREAAQQTLQRLTDDGVPLVGAVLTDRHCDLPTWLERLL
jgi:capsular exopolysaccharide synthesis family protein